MGQSCAGQSRGFDTYFISEKLFFKGTLLSIALTCMKIFIYKQKWPFIKEADTLYCYMTDKHAAEYSNPVCWGVK